MGRRKSPEESPQSPEQKSGNGDRYPTAVDGLRRIISEANLPEGPIEFLQVEFLASGEVVYTMREPRADEADGGYLAPAGS
jgi:hypothetical protein